jgi:O-antigen biosynthesis protein
MRLNRRALKRLIPARARKGLERLRDVLNGPGLEYDVVRDYRFEPDRDRRARINLVLPGISSATAFGGVMTGLTFFQGLAAALAGDGVETRIVTEEPLRPGETVLADRPGLRHCPTHALRPSGERLPVRAGDLFIVFNWWTSVNLDPVLGAQAAHFGQPIRPKIHLVQEYEPGLHRFSTAHALAREAFDGPGRLWAAFNTHELFDYWTAQGHRAEKSWVFEPRMTAAIRPFADNLSAADKTRTLLVYARPTVARNAFFLVRRGLEHWARSHGADHADWRIVSAGLPHDDIPLGGGHRLVSLGKLGLQEYGQLLRETAVGLSLMISPHPSYPPLEMAHFGVRVVTNGYANKRPADRHENLIAVPHLRPEAIAETLEQAIRGFEADPAAGLGAKSHMPDYLLEDRIDCIDAIAAELRVLIQGVSLGARPRMPVQLR